jgi:hypothetical protein
MSYFYEGEDVEGAGMWLKEAAWRTGGVLCPCCGRHVQVYKRHLPTDVARFMVLLVRAWLKVPEGRREWIDIRHFSFRGGDYAKAIHWGLAALKENTTDPEKKNCGLWRPTILGTTFVRGQVKIPSHVFLYLNEVVGHSERLIDIQEALGKKFNYEELMNS